MKLYKLPLRQRLLNWARLPLKLVLKLVVPVLAIRGRYPWWVLTPDDPRSPFGCGTTPGASREQTMVDIYARFGRWVGDVVWLAWRNSGYALAYAVKPEFLKRPGIRYMDLVIDDRRTPDLRAQLDPDGTYSDNSAERVGTVYVQAPDGTWLWETTRKLGPVYLITGYRLSGIASGQYEDWMRETLGGRPVPRPLYHPNMDGRPIVSLRSARTM